MVSGGLLTDWGQWMLAAGMSKRTIAERIQLIQRFEASLGVDSTMVEWQDLAAFLATDRFQPGTRQTYHAHLKAWFHWLVLMDYRESDPTIKLRKPTAPKRKPRPITLEQLSRILRTRMHHRTRVMVLLGAYQGFRVHEIAKIRGEHLTEEVLRVTGKGGRVDELPAHDLVVEIARTMPSSGYWFPSHTRIGPVTSKAVSRIISDLMHRAGVAATPHCLRHFYGTELLKSTGDLALVQQLMRHENIATTVLYTKVQDSPLRDAVRSLPIPLRVVS